MPEDSSSILNRPNDAGDTVDQECWAQEGIAIALAELRSTYPLREKTVLDGSLSGLDLSRCNKAGEVIGNKIESFLPSVGAASFLPPLY